MPQSPLQAALDRVSIEHLTNPLGPVLEDLDRKSAIRERLAFERAKGDIETQRAEKLLNARLNFETAQGELNRQNHLEAIKMQANAFADRLTAAEKTKVIGDWREKGIKIDPKKPIDDQLSEGYEALATGNYPLAIGSTRYYHQLSDELAAFDTKVQKQQEKVDTARAADARAMESEARDIAKGQGTKAFMLNVDKDISSKIGNYPTDESLRTTKNLDANTKERLRVQLRNAIDAALPIARIDVREKKFAAPSREEADAVRELNTFIAQRSAKAAEFARFQISDQGKLALNKIAVDAGKAGPPQPAVTPGPGGPSIDVNAPTLPATPGGTAPDEGGAAAGIPVGGTRLRVADFLRSKAAGGATAAPAPAGTGSNGVFPGTTTIPGMGGSTVNLLSGFDPMTTGGNQPIRSSLPWEGKFNPAGGNFSTPSAGAQDAQVAALFGPDAAELLPEAAQFAESRGVPQEAQQAKLNAALAGDKQAQQQVGEVIAYIRRQRQLRSTPTSGSDFFGPQYNTPQPELFPMR